MEKSEKGGEKEGIGNLIQENDLCELLSIKRGTLDHLRRSKAFPFISISPQARIYLESDVMEWLKKNRKILHSETESE